MVIFNAQISESINLLKAHLTTTPVLGYQDFSHHFGLETNASLQGLGAVLSQSDKQGQSKVIANANLSLYPNEMKMRK